MRHVCTLGLRGLIYWASVLFLLGLWPAAAWAQADEQEEDEDLPRGLIAVYTSQQEPAEVARRVDRVLAFNWKNRTPDPRLSAGPFKAQWRGYLLTPGPGEYRLSAHAAGAVTITLAGERILDAAAETPQWQDARPLELPFGWHALEIDYVAQGPSPKLGLFWSGPQFALEPISDRQFYHDAEDSPSGRFERGESLVAALRCLACHGTQQETATLSAPALDRLSGNLSQAWLIDWLTGPEPAAGEQPDGRPTAFTRRMPHFAFTEDEAQAIAAYLLPASNSTAASTANRPAQKGAPKKPGAKEKEKPKPSASEGERLFVTVGCLACHQVGELGNSGLFGGGDLTKVASKRPADFFARWLADPAAINRDHRMPVFDLSDYERQSLAFYLAGQSDEAAAWKAPPGADANLAREGKRLVEANRCGACHTLPDDAAPWAHVARLGEISAWARACTGEPQPGKRPGFRLSASDATAIREAVTAIAAVKKPAPQRLDARRLSREQNCLACHERGESAGLAPHLTKVIGAHGDLAPLLPAMTPPPLISVGDKLHDRALADAIRRAGKVHRPYLAVRMPKFRLSDEQVQILTQQLIGHDRIPPRPADTAPPSPAPKTATIDAAGARLVTSDGFGCVSCHAIGSVQPEKAPLNARGPDLSLLSQRIRREWFDRWVRNPARIIPRMEMPAVQLPVRGVLDDDLHRQLAAVWHVLNIPGFEPPPPNPVRVLRRSGLQERNEWAAVGTDVLQDRGRQYIKPFLVGLPNRHNVLFDLEQNRMAGWWLGDVARQRTQGKSWYWESGAGHYDHLLQSAPEGSELLLEIDGQRLAARLVGQFPTEVDEWRHVGGGLLWRQRLQFAASDGAAPITLFVEHELQPLWPQSANDATGFRRTLEVRGVPAGARVVFRAPGKKDLGEGRVELTAPDAAALDADGSVVLTPRGEQGAVSVELHYLANRQPDTFPTEPPPAPALQPMELSVAPGFQTMQLPLSEAIMPTALTWTPEGTLAIASLKGQVWLARDTDRDGLEDSAEPLSDDLAAPYGLAAGQQKTDEGKKAAYVDVINKYALLRLWDEDGDGRAERTVTLASGWGHTADYHDWAVGLPRDEQGNYYVAFPCQQDDRSVAAARWRGALLRLVPRQPTAADPHPFAIETVTAGHRFPMGIARRRDGELFVTDNQGNYNPFNELNHIVPGRHYGFINKREQSPDFKPPLTPPAIDLPHPWTRSVNGICFLDTPPAVREKLGRDAFGPFEGHLVGCEMNNKLLVRMTLQRVGDVIQGAAYPMSYLAPKEGNAFLGPLCAEVSPQGELYVGSLLDSGWGGGNNIGAVVRMRPVPEELPAGIREVRAEPRGLVVEFTRPVDRALAADRGNYSVASYTRVSTPAYGGPDVDRRNEEISEIEVAPDGLSAALTLRSWREGYVYELHLKNLAGSGQEFFPDEAHYTLRRAPRE